MPFKGASFFAGRFAASSLTENKCHAADQRGKIDLQLHCGVEGVTVQASSQFTHFPVVALKLPL